MENINKFNKELQELAILKQNIHGLRKLFDEINNEDIKKELKEIIKISDKIYKEIIVNTEKLYKIEKFNNYYLITVEKVVRKYIKLSKNNVSTSFNNLYQSLYNDEVIDIDAEMKVMEKEMKL